MHYVLNAIQKYFIKQFQMFGVLRVLTNLRHLIVIKLFSTLVKQPHHVQFMLCNSSRTRLQIMMVVLNQYQNYTLNTIFNWRLKTFTFKSHAYSSLKGNAGFQRQSSKCRHTSQNKTVTM